METMQYAVRVVGDDKSPRGCAGLWPTHETRITSPFGWRIHPKQNKKKFHNGIDIGTLRKIGVFVIAPVGGTVKWSESKAGGLQLSLITPTVTYVFCHLSERLAPDGAHVPIGTLIARTGNTGGSTGPHLHFGMREGGDYVDPMSFWWVKIDGFEGFPYKPSN